MRIPNLLYLLSLISTGVYAQKPLTFLLEDSTTVRMEIRETEPGYPDTLIRLNTKKIKNAQVSVYRDTAMQHLFYRACYSKKGPDRSETYYFSDGRIKKIREISHRKVSSEPSRVWVRYRSWWPNGVMRCTGAFLLPENPTLIRVGVWLFWSEEGWLSRSGMYNHNGKPDGAFQLFYKNGKQKIKGHYRNGKRVGNWTVYDYEGQMIREIEYKE